MPLAWWYRKSLRWPSTRTDFLWWLFTTLFFFAHLVTYFYAAQTTTIANCLILFCTNPLWTALGAYFWYQEPVRGRLMLAYLSGLAGITVLVVNRIQVAPEAWRGDASALLSAFLFAGYMLTGKRLRQRCDNLPFAMGMYTLTGLLFLALCFFTNQADVIATQALLWPLPSRVWIALAILIGLTTYGGHFVMTRLMTHLPLNLMTCGKTIEPVLASLFAIVLFHEIPTLTTGIAFVLSSFSILLLFS